MKIKVTGTPDEIATLVDALEHSAVFSSVKTTNISKYDASHKTGSALVFITFGDQLKTNDIPVEVYQRRRKGQPKRSDQPGYIYVMRGPVEGGVETYKIGKTSNPHSRRKTFGVKMPFKAEFIQIIKTDQMSALEKGLHEYFKAKRLAGSEFFALEQRDLYFLKQLGDECPLNQLKRRLETADYRMEAK